MKDSVTANYLMPSYAIAKDCLECVRGSFEKNIATVKIDNDSHPTNVFLVVETPDECVEQWVESFVKGVLACRKMAK